MNGPWYSTETAMELLGLKREELLFHVEKFNIYPVLFTKERPFLLFEKGLQKKWVGYATCTYRGHVLLLETDILRLLDDSEIRLGDDCKVRLEEPDNIRNLSYDYPFESPLPLGRISHWREHERSDCYEYEYEGLGWGYATPLPVEERSPQSILNTLVKSFATGEDQSTLPPEKKVLNFHQNSLFRISDMRFAASEIERLQSTLSQEVKKEVESFTPQPPTLKGKRISQLHELIFRALVANPSASAKALWSLIQQDYELDSPAYDIDGIIRVMDASCIEWCSRNGNPQSMKWGSFQTLLPKLKKQLV